MTMVTRLRLIHLDELEVAVWLTATKDPPPVQWAEACAKLAASVRAAANDVSVHRIFVVSDGGSPSSAQRRELFEDVLRGHPVPTAVVSRAMTTNPVRRGMAAAMHLLKPHYRVFEPKEVPLALDHIGVARTRFDPIWKTLRFLQESLPPVVTMRLIGEEFNLPFEPLRPSQIPPSSPPPAK
jgi:hypothetical protein